MRHAMWLMTLLSIGCGATSTAATASTTGGGERPAISVRPITASTASATVSPTAMSREDFEAQWAGSATAVPAPRVAPASPYAAYGGLGADLEHPIAACGTSDSYAIVASYVCVDGSMPLGGDPSRGASARMGNVGANTRTGHIIDLYSVPCPTGPVELYVDLYGCPGGGSPF